MPRWASRITLEVHEVRPERLQDISVADCRAEGVGAGLNDVGCRYAFGAAWNEIYENMGFAWDANPWVWVIRFRKTKP